MAGFSFPIGQPKSRGHTILQGGMMDWRECPGFPAYEVSEFGDIRRGGRVLKPFKSDGYWKYSLSVDGKQYNVFAHRMVAMAFISPPPFEGALSCHCDGSRTKNHYSNLRWDTPKGNVADAIVHGTFCFPTYRSLSPAKVQKIRQLVAAGNTQADTAREFQVSRQNVLRIIRRETWKHVA